MTVRSTNQTRYVPITFVAILVVADEAARAAIEHDQEFDPRIAAYLATKQEPVKWE